MKQPCSVSPANWRPRDHGPGTAHQSRPSAPVATGQGQGGGQRSKHGEEGRWKSCPAFTSYARRWPPVFPDPRIWTSVYLLVGEHCAVVDSAVPRSADRLILPYLDKVGIPTDRLRAIVNTHGHNDHVGLERASARGVRCPDYAA